MDQFIDIIEGNRKYVRCLYVYHKIDMSSMEEVSMHVCILHFSRVFQAAAWTTGHGRAEREHFRLHLLYETQFSKARVA